jgi:iron(III) transport system permease protein
VARRDIRRLDTSLFVVCAVVLCLTVAYPALRLVVTAVREWATEALVHNPGRAAIINTAIMSFATVITSGMVGSALAFLLTRYRFPGRRVLSGLAYMPFTLPPLVGVLSFYYLVGLDGVLPRFCERYLGLEDVALRGPWAILLVHTYSFYVYFYAMVGAALDTVDVAQLEAARTLGAGRVRVFFRVMLPMLKPAVLGAALLTFMSSGASFSAPYIFGSRYPMLSVEIFNERSQFNDARAATLTVVLAVVSLLGVLVFRSRKKAAGGGSKGVRVPLRSRTGRLVASLGAGFCIALVLLPHLTILWLSFVDHRAWHTELVPTVFTWANYREIFTSAQAFAPIRNSLWMSVLAAGACLFIALPAGYLIGRRRPGAAWINVLVMIPWALPGTVIAMNLIVSFNHPKFPLVGTVWILPLAYFIRNVPLLTRISTAAIEPFDPSLLEAGQTLGGSRWFCFRRIVLPLIAPAIGAGTALVFATCLGEFVASILLYVYRNIPISVQIAMMWRGATGIGPAFAYSVLLMLLVASTFIISRRFTSRVF